MPHTPLRRRRRRSVASAAAAAVVAAVALPGAADAAVVATFQPAGQTLTVIGDDLRNEVVVSRNSGGALLVNGGAVQILGGTATVANTAQIQLFGQADADNLRLDERNGALPRANLFGGTGDDFMVGGSKVDMLFGQSGNDTADGRGGADLVFLADGADKALWSVTGGADAVYGGADRDRVRMVGSAADDGFRTSTDGSLAKLVHDRSATVVGAHDVEEAVLTAAGGADNVTLGSLAGTAMGKVAVDLAAAGGAAGDGQPDRIKLVGDATTGDVVTVAGDGAAAAPLGTTVTVRAGEAALDKVNVETRGGGRDIVDASELPAASAALTVVSGDGADLVSGGHGDDKIDAGSGDDDVRAGAGKDNVIAEAGLDTVDGGDGNDILDGRGGDDEIDAGPGDDAVYGGLDSDTVRLGAGNDRFLKAGGHGSDTVEGEDGHDRVTHFGTSADERLDVSKSGQRVRLVRSVGTSPEVSDLDGIERIAPDSSTGEDSLTINDVTGTALREVDVDLAGTGQRDLVQVLGTPGADEVFMSGTPAKTLIVGLAATVRLNNGDTDDALTVHALIGDDSVDASRHEGGGPKLTIDGNGGADTVLGSLGREVVLGGSGADRIDGRRGDDLVMLGTGDDAFGWTAGDGSDVVIGQTGRDRLELAGNSAAESIALEADGDGDGVRLTRDVGDVAMSLHGLEELAVSAAGGGDAVKVGDLTGTGVASVTTQLGTGDGAADRAEVDGTSGDDRIALTGRDGTVTVGGLPAATAVSGAGEEDRLEVRGLAGADSFDTSGLGPIAFGLSLSS